jgi:hypothetical protein
MGQAASVAFGLAPPTGFQPGGVDASARSEGSGGTVTADLEAGQEAQAKGTSMTGARTIHELRAVISSQMEGFAARLNEGAKASEQFAQKWIKAGQDVRASVAAIDKAATRTVLTLAGLATAGIAVAARFAKAAETQRSAEKNLQASLDATGNAARLSLDELKNFASARQAVTNFGDEVTLQGAAVLATFKSIQGDAFQRTLALAQDLSEKGLGTLESSVVQLGKALEDPNIGLMALRRVGVSFNETERETIQLLVESGRQMEAQQVILQAVEGQVGGTAEAMMRPWTRFLNAMSDIEENLGLVLLPGLDALGNILLSLIGPVAQNEQQFKIWGSQFGEFVTAHKPQIEAFVNGAIQGIKDLTQYLREQGPALMETGRAWLQFLNPILDFLAEHPQIVAALLFFKSGQMLGINDVVFKLGQTFISLTNAVGGTNSIVGALATIGLPALAVALGVVVGKILYDLHPAVRDLNAELDRAKGLDDEISARQERNRQRVLNRARMSDDPSATREFLAQQLEQAKREAAGAKSSAAGARTNYEQISKTTSERSFLEGQFSEVVADSKREMQQAEANAKSAARWVMTLETELEQLDLRLQRDQRQAAGGTPAGGALPAGLPSLDELRAEAQAKKEADKAAEKAKKDAELEAEKQAAEEAKRPFDQMADAIKRASQAAAKSAEFEDRITEARRQLYAEGTSENVMATFQHQTKIFQDQLLALNQKFRDGAITADEFKSETEKLSKALDAAARGAQEQEKAERRAMMVRILSGQGTQQDYMKLQAMQQAAYMDQFWQNVESQFNQTFLTFNNGVQTVANQFDNLASGMQSFGQNLQGIFGGGPGGNAPSASEAATAISSMLNSAEGMAAVLFNNIAMLKQAMQFADGQERVQLQKQIAALQQQLADFTRPRAPIFSGSSLEVAGRGGIGQQTNRFELSFPNWSPQNALDIRYLAEAVVAEMERRGRRN